MSDVWSSLAGALTGVPELRGARCRGQWEVWDETDDPELIEFAKNQCLACPALAECKEWFVSLKPSKRPIGTVAGQLVHQHKKGVAA
jgi:WhiB family transcriptional regulator, redox-sensing transcriptional regulator